MNSYRLNILPQRPTRMGHSALHASRLACVLVAGAIAAPSAQQAEVGSVEHVRAALLKPPFLLTLEIPKPDFVVHIEERRPLQDIFDLPPWAAPPSAPQVRVMTITKIEGTPVALPTAGAGGGGGVDLLALSKHLAQIKRDHDARSEVRRAIADYCAAQPNAASIQICFASAAR